MNIFNLPTLPLPEELTNILAQSPNIRIERIISTGHTSDWYDQEQAEFVVLLEGHAEIAFEDKPTLVMKKGDTFLIEPHVRHRVSYTSSDPPCLWLCVFYGE